jgi:hypothetical protein
MDFARQPHHIPFMTGKKPRRQKQSAQLTRALARWESEGGAPQPKSENNRETRAALAKEEEHVLRCLGAAVIMQWNDLPTKIQRDLFDHAISMGEPRRTAQLKEPRVSFIGTRMTNPVKYPPRPPSRPGLERSVPVNLREPFRV